MIRTDNTSVSSENVTTILTQRTGAEYLEGSYQPYLLVLYVMFIQVAFLFGSISGKQTEESCHAAVIVCFIFYLGGKLLLYLFLCERV